MLSIVLHRCSILRVMCRGGCVTVQLLSTVNVVFGIQSKFIWSTKLPFHEYADSLSKQKKSVKFCLTSTKG